MCAWPVLSKWVRAWLVTRNYTWLRFANEAGFELRYHSIMHLIKRLAAGLLACSILLQPLRANELPELGDVASEDLSLATEKRIGRQIMNEIRWREPSYLDDSDIEAYLNQIGGRLAAVSSDPGMGFFFFPINDPTINAFAMPGGYIGVHTGLILSAQSESELAGVMSHEISHVTQRHIARQVFQSKKIGMASMVAMGLALLAARSNSQVSSAAMATSQAGAISAQLAFSRDFERESDRLGFDILRKAGMDVRGMSAFFERLQGVVRVSENTATAYLRTHPLTSERLTDMQNREQSSAYRQVADSVDFILVRAKLRAMLGTPSEAVKDFGMLLRDKKYTSEAATRYGLAYALYRNRDLVGAEREIQAARRLKASSAMIERLLADIRIAQGDIAGGITVYHDAMVRFPMHKGLVYGYAEALIRAKRFDEAQRFVVGQLQNYPDDVRLYKMRAESYAGMGKMAQQHQALAEAFALQGQTSPAIQQLELAQRAGDASFYEMSTIDGRLRELRRQLADELKEKRN
jgi:predicted Zn-dependent protease